VSERQLNQGEKHMNVYEDNDIYSFPLKKKKKLEEFEIIEWLERNGTFFVDQHFEFYYKSSRTINIDSIYFDKIIGTFYTSVTGDIISKRLLNRIKDESKERALDNKFETFNRIGIKNNIIYYDLGQRGIVQISSNGWNILKKEPDNIFFRRYRHNTDQVEPCPPSEDFNVDEFLNFIFNLKSKTDYNLFKVYLITCFIPNVNHPLLSLFGPEGSGKTKFLEFIKQIVDPSLVLTTELSRYEKTRNRDLFQNYLICFDNLTHIDTTKTHNKISDQLERAITGKGLIEFHHGKYKREMKCYTGRTIVCISSINNLVKTTKLANISLSFKLKQIKNPIPENELGDVFFKGLPSLLGWIFNTLSKYLRKKKYENYFFKEERS